jgi:hypothetical protein
MKGLEGFFRLSRGFFCLSDSNLELPHAHRAEQVPGVLKLLSPTLALPFENVAA